MESDTILNDLSPVRFSHRAFFVPFCLAVNAGDPWGDPCEDGPRDGACFLRDFADENILAEELNFITTFAVG